MEERVGIHPPGIIDENFCTHWNDFRNFTFGNINRVICTTRIIKVVHIAIPNFFPLFKRSYVALLIKNTHFQQHKRRLYIWISSDDQHQNQIDYILCSHRWRSSIQSAKVGLGADLWLRSWTPDLQIQT